MPPRFDKSREEKNAAQKSFDEAAKKLLEKINSDRQAEYENSRFKSIFAPPKNFTQKQIEAYIQDRIWYNEHGPTENDYKSGGYRREPSPYNVDGNLDRFIDSNDDLYRKSKKCYETLREKTKAEKESKELKSEYKDAILKAFNELQASSGEKKADKYEDMIAALSGMTSEAEHIKALRAAVEGNAGDNFDYEAARKLAGVINDYLLTATPDKPINNPVMENLRRDPYFIKIMEDNKLDCAGFYSNSANKENTYIKVSNKSNETQFEIHKSDTGELIIKNINPSLSKETLEKIKEEIGKKYHCEPPRIESLSALLGKQNFSEILAANYNAEKATNAKTGREYILVSDKSDPSNAAFKIYQENGRLIIREAVPPLEESKEIAKKITEQFASVPYTITPLESKLRVLNDNIQSGTGDKPGHSALFMEILGDLRSKFEISPDFYVDINDKNGNPKTLHTIMIEYCARADGSPKRNYAGICANLRSIAALIDGPLPSNTNAGSNIKNDEGKRSFNEFADNILDSNVLISISAKAVSTSKKSATHLEALKTNIEKTLTTTAGFKLDIGLDATGQQSHILITNDSPGPNRVEIKISRSAEHPGSFIVEQGTQNQATDDALKILRKELPSSAPIAATLFNRPKTTYKYKPIKQQFAELNSLVAAAVLDTNKATSICQAIGAQLIGNLPKQRGLTVKPNVESADSMVHVTTEGVITLQNPRADKIGQTKGVGATLLAHANFYRNLAVPRDINKATNLENLAKQFVLISAIAAGHVKDQSLLDDAITQVTQLVKCKSQYLI
jgi:hypothetical protein